MIGQNKRRFLFLVATAFLVNVALSQEDYTLRINDTVVGLSLDRAYTVTVDGKPFQLLLQARDTLLYQDSLFSFQYPKDLKVSRIEAVKNVDQIMMINAAGTGFLIQAYRTFNPENIREAIVEQATKENSAYGYTLERSESSRTLRSGQRVAVTKLVQRYKDNVRTYEVAILAGKDEGLAVVTFVVPTGSGAGEKDPIALMWQSLLYKPKADQQSPPGSKQ